jgi:hypothetical protein
MSWSFLSDITIRLKVALKIPQRRHRASLSEAIAGLSWVRDGVLAENYWSHLTVFNRIARSMRIPGKALKKSREKSIWLFS